MIQPQCKSWLFKKVPWWQWDEYLKFYHFYWWINVWFHSVPCLSLLLVQCIPSSPLHFCPRWKRNFNCIYLPKFCVSFFAVGPEISFVSISKGVLSFRANNWISRWVEVWSMMHAEIFSGTWGHLASFLLVAVLASGLWVTGMSFSLVPTAADITIFLLHGIEPFFWKQEMWISFFVDDGHSKCWWFCSDDPGTPGLGTGWKCHFKILIIKNLLVKLKGYDILKLNTIPYLWSKQGLLSQWHGLCFWGEEQTGNGPEFP